MTRVAVISDIHGNLHALEAVLARSDDLGCVRIVCLGDLVGYGAFPEACVRIVRERGIACVMGNHDAAAAGLRSTADFNEVARTAVEWTRGQLAAASLDFLAGLPDRQEDADGTLYVHGSPYGAFDYLVVERQLAGVAERLRKERGPVTCFFGHTHTPLCFAGGGRREPGGEPCRPAAGEVLLVNPGSVGQPRDGDPRASFAVRDADTGTVVIERVAYDVEAARRAIHATGLPPLLGDRLLSGA
jgi:predicted phosphodiesterase